MANCQKHYKCVPPDEFKPLQAKTLGILSVIFAVVGGVSGQWLLGAVSAAVFIAGVFDLCRFLHGGKLVCFEENVCVIGKVVARHPVGSDKSGFDKMDDDYTFDITLSPHAESESINDIAITDTNQGRFVSEQSVLQTLSTPPYGGGGETLHCEVKGCRVHDVCIVLKIMSFPIAAALVACTVPVVGWLACLLALLILLVITAIIGGIVWAATHNGDIYDVLDPASGEMNIGDVVIVKGDWVYDAGHDTGQNEIHPVRSVQVIKVAAKYKPTAAADSQLVADFKKEAYDPWCAAVAEAESGPVRIEQDKPKNSWRIHPKIDGCRSGDVVK